MVSEAQAEKQRADGERHAAKLWRAFRTTLQMLNDRGYIISGEELALTLDGFILRFSDGNGQVETSRMKYSAMPSPTLYEKMHNPNATDDKLDVGPIWVEFNSDENVGIKQMRTFAQYCTQNHFSTGILVTAVHITPSALKIIPAVANEIRIECFQDTDLLVNITHHELVPQHSLLSRAEKTALLKRYRLKETQLPRIQLADPVAKYYGLRRGQVVKIIRKSETAGRYASYRLCV